MQVILLEDVPSLGKAGDLVKVSDGYGRNFLIPQKKAILATEKGVKMLEHQKRLVQHRMGKMKKDHGKGRPGDRSALLHLYKSRLEKAENFSVRSRRWKLRHYLKENGIEVDRKKIVLGRTH